MRQTITTQRLFMLAGLRSGYTAQYRLIGLWYRYHHENTIDAADPLFLSKLACVGIPGPSGKPTSLFGGEDEALRWLESDALREEVLSAARAARIKGVKAMPLMVLNGKYAVCGAQTINKYTEASRRELDILSNADKCAA